MLPGLLPFSARFTAKRVRDFLVWDVDREQRIKTRKFREEFESGTFNVRGRPEFEHLFELGLTEKEAVATAAFMYKLSGGNKGGTIIAK